MNEPKVDTQKNNKKSTTEKDPPILLGPVRDVDMSTPDSQEIYDDNISQYETSASELEKGQDEELQEDMKNHNGGR